MHLRVTLAALIASAFGRASVGAAEDTRVRGGTATPESRTPSMEREAAVKKLKMPGVAINLEERCVDIEGMICLDKGMLELVACTKGSKEDESIVAIAARPMHIHTAFQL